MIEKYGAAAVRVCSLFAAPPAQELEWSDSGLEGSYRFINKIYRLTLTFIQAKKTQPITPLDVKSLNQAQKIIRQKTHQTLAKITDDMSRRHAFNTAIAALMGLANVLDKFHAIDAQSMSVRFESINIILCALSPIAPHICHYLWQQLGNETAIINEPWPVVDTQALEQDEVQIIIQVNGKLRAKIMVAANTDNKILENLALSNDNIAKFIQDKNVVKVIVVPNKLVNIVAR
jgi:leucyl-tRNA synthetase